MLKAKGNEVKEDDTAYHCKEGWVHWEEEVSCYLVDELLKRRERASWITASSSDDEYSDGSMVSFDQEIRDRQGFRFPHRFDLTPPYIPQHNRVFERRNHTLLDMVRSMMNLTTLSLSFWDYALESATRILNMVPTKKGCEALVKRDTPDKLQQRSVKCIFIGYPKETMGYYFYFPPKNKIVVARYAEFFKKNLITQEVSRRAIDLEEIQDGQLTSVLV
ncbi:retrotransposon protein, putative, ty1-copia subclass [Tanacetum coccineum]